MLTPKELAVVTNTLAVSIAGAVADTDKLAVIAAIFVQLGDTLATVAATQSLQQSKINKTP